MPLHRGTVASGSFSTPSAPTSLSASSAANAQSVLAWVAPTENGGSAISDYIVQYSTDNSNWTTFSDGVSSSTGATVTGLSNGTLYYFRVAAINGYGTGSYANTSATPSTIPSAPATPTITAADAGDTFNWTAPSSGGRAITGYVYQISTNNGAFASEVSVGAGVTSVAVGNQYSANAFKIKVRAVNDNGTSTFSTTSNNTVVWVSEAGTVPHPTPCTTDPCTCTAPTCTGCGTCPACTEDCAGCGTASSSGLPGSNTATAGTSTLTSSNSNTRTCYRWTRTAAGSTASGYSYNNGTTDPCSSNYTGCTGRECSACTEGSCSGCTSTCTCSACGTWSSTVNNPGGGPTITLTNGTYPYAYYSVAFPSGWVYSSQDGNTLYYQGQYSGEACAGYYLGPNDVQGCSEGGNRVVGGDACRSNEFS